MGSVLNLSVGCLEVDWGKNYGFQDHRPLFQENDVCNVPYWYADPSDPDDDSVYQVMQEGLSKPLASIVRRLALLGYTERIIQLQFKALSYMNGFHGKGYAFDDLKSAIATVDVESISANYGEGGEDFGKFFRREIAPRIGLEGRDGFSDFAEGMENLGAYGVLILLQHNKKASELPVIWSYEDVRKNGWADRSEFVGPLTPSERFIVVTEGKSDSDIIRKSFDFLMPDVSDFFKYIDVNEGYPFTGVGNMTNFAQGMSNIGVLNNILFVYDNDAAGIAASRKFQESISSDNVKCITLPYRDELNSVHTLGPNGASVADINGRAASIECYLDVSKPVSIRWTSYEKSIDSYHGEIEDKKDRIRQFHDASNNDFHGYDLTGLKIIVETIYQSCVEIVESRNITAYKNEIENNRTIYASRMDDKNLF